MRLIMEFNTGERLRRLREYYRKWTKYKLSMESGVDAKFIKKIENNESRPSVEEIEKICNGLQIPLPLFFMPTSVEYNNDVEWKGNIEFDIHKIKIEKILSGFDFRFNTKNIYSKCKKSIWYNGYICSAYYDEAEIRIYAEGNVKATIYHHYEEILSINGEDAGEKLMEFVSSDEELDKKAVWGDFDENELRLHNGEVIFISESNWLFAQVYNHETLEYSEPEILDYDDIFGLFNAPDNVLLKYIYDSGVF